ncbi:MAG: S-layer homology domain-containing protein [Peptoniphilus lacrimalis]|uniref:S-layer homology domain-containing protein n=1 Tax=Peptoniphilus lacrimalis TaxID=33031 RepID=UPI00254F903A|nr:S-layer homology domain-containing protein [Peptoniphilus lacrimalis]MDK8281340.1 S-layer homology domain-containing protein [Peptoniphilus lacrimalis]
MRRKILTGILALVFILQAFIPNLAYANQAKPQDTKLISEAHSVQDNLVTIGKLKGVGFSKDNLTASISIEGVEEKNHKNTDALNGLELSDEIIPEAVRGTGSQYIEGQQPADADKPKYWANVKGKLTTRGIDGTTFDWEKILGKGAKIKLLFTQTNGYVMTGVTYSLLVDKDGTYTWQGSDGKPTYLPIFDENGNGYSYNVQIERNYGEDVQLIISESNGTPGVSWRPEGNKQVATISFLNIEIQQVASTKFVSEWNTALAKEDRPQIKGYFEADTDVDNDFNFPLNNTDETILRDGFLKNFEEGDEENGPWSFLSSELKTTPKIVKVKTDTTGLTFDEKDGVKTVKSGDHKFKYDFNYDVINGGKLTMTEILPVTFYANGGKFANFTSLDTETKIVKEVEYEKNLTEKAENPTKDRETFKGWATSKDGTPLSENDFNEAIKNIKEAKEFYAIWDNNEIQAEELTVHESFKDGDTWVNDFIPTLDKLKEQVKIKDGSGTPQALTDDDKLEILDDSGNVIADADLKYKLYEKLKEDDATEVSRNVTLKAKVNLTNGTSQTVDIPIKVIKNIYEAKTLTEKPYYVPNGYVKVTLDPTTKAQIPQKTYYYVNPAAKVVIPGEDPTATDGNVFTKWTEGKNDYTLGKRHKFKTDTIITAQYSSDVISQDGPNKPDTVPANFVEVKFVPTDKAKDTTEKIFYVNSNKDVTIPIKDPEAKATYTFKEWKIGVNADGDVYTPSTARKFTEAITVITATYEEGTNIIPFDPKAENPMVRPDGYVKLTFDADLGLKLTESKAFYVKKNANVKLSQLEKPKYDQAKGYAFDGWDKADNTVINEDMVVTAKAKESSSPAPSPDPSPSPTPTPDSSPSYPRVVHRDRIVEKEKIVEKIVRVGESQFFKEVRYMQGFDGYFRPNDGLTRAEAAQILANALVEDGYKYNPNFKISYKDIGEAWYTRAVKIVTEAKVFAGYDDGNFKPQAKITRNEWIATLKRFQELGDASGNNMNLRDGHWAKGEIQAAFNEGWLKIYTDGLATYKGDEFIPRQEVAAVSNKAFKRIVDKTYIGKNNLSLITYKDVNTSMWSYEDILCASNTFLDRKDRYIAHWVKEDKNQFNIDTSDLKIVQKNFQRNPR